MRIVELLCSGEKEEEKIKASEAHSPQFMT
jgi:hypothetical protein